MKKYFFILLPLILGGCVFPKFYESTQSVYFDKSPEMTLTLENYGDVISPQVTVQREFSSLKGTLSKKGFKNKEIEFKSHWTSDDWAIAITKHGKAEYPGWRLLPPTQTIVMPIEGAILGINLPFMGSEEHGPWSYVAAPFTCIYFTASGLISGALIDSFTLVTLAWPRAVIGNPWYEYDKYIDLSKEILTPTPEFEKTCHSKNNKFIGNNNCISCKTKGDIISTQEECNRCPNRKWENFECRLKTKH